MRSVIFWMLGIIGLVALGVLLATSMQDREKPFDERVTLREKDKIPYGLYVMRQMLPSLFPGAEVHTSAESPIEWKKVDPGMKGQLVIFPCLQFNANTEELHYLYNLVNTGNHVLILSKGLSYDAKTFFGLNYGNIFGDTYGSTEETGLTVSLVPPAVKKEERYSYKGKRFSSSASEFDTTRVVVLGKNEEGEAHYIRLESGEGSMNIHLAPLAYSNYFLLQDSNMRYLERSLSALPSNITKVVWDEYYFYKRNIDKKEPSWLGVLFRFQSFRWAFLSALFLLILYTLLEMRRRQRPIPVIKKPRNDSLDFVETIGRLYYDTKDHKDLAMKMTSYFLDDVRNRFKLSTSVIDDAFTQALQVKSGYPADRLANLIAMVEYVKQEPELEESTLFRYHKQLEHFYQHS